MGNTVSLALICKNEQANIGLLMDDVCPVLEEVIVVDTGSEDETLSILQDKKRKYSNLYVHSFDWIDDFSAARNFSFGLASQEWVFWVDGDDRVDAQSLKYFKDNILDNPAVEVWMLDYIYSKLPDGSPRTILTRERFIRNAKNPRWMGAIHETVNISGLVQEYYGDLKIVHNSKGKQIESGRNLRILAKEYEHNKNDPRTAYYYGKELFDHVRSDEAQVVLEHYLTLNHRYWDDECNARSRLARIYLAKRRHRDALKCADEIYHLDSSRRRADYYFIYGLVEQDLTNYQVAIEWYTRAICEPPPPPRVLTLEFYTWHPRYKIVECYRNLGQWSYIPHYLKELKSILHEDPNFLEWRKQFENVTLDPLPGHKLVTLEIGTALRYDSYRFTAEGKPEQDLITGTSEGNSIVIRDVDLLDLPFAEESFDGLVVSDGLLYTQRYQYFECNLKKLEKLVKPGGFVWVQRDKSYTIYHYDHLNYICTAEHQKFQVKNFIKQDKNKPSIAYRESSRDSAPYRYRIENLIKSASKKGFPVFDLDDGEKKCDYFVSLNLASEEKKEGTIYVLEICELLPNYDNYGVDKADVLNASSPLLAERLQEKFPSIPVINVDDHFEIPNEGWL